MRPSVVVNRVPPSHDKLVTFTTGSIKRRHLLTVGDGWRSATHQWILFMTGSLDIMPKTKEQNFIVLVGKSESGITNSKRLCLRYCAVEVNYWQTQTIVQPVWESRYSCYAAYSCVSWVTGWASYTACSCVSWVTGWASYTAYSCVSWVTGWASCFHPVNIFSIVMHETCHCCWKPQQFWLMFC